MTTSLRLATAVGFLFGLGSVGCGTSDNGGKGNAGGGPGTGGGVGSGFGGGVGSGFGGQGGVGGGAGGVGGGAGGVGGGVGGVGGGVGGVGGGVGGTGGGVGGTGGGVGGTDGGVGGTGGGGTGGVGGSGLADCDGRNETPKNPITQACGSFTTPYPPGTGTKVQLGPYGARMDVNVGKGFETTCSNDTATCPGFVGIFDAPPTEPMTQQLLDVGPQPCTASTPNTGDCLNLSLYSVYYPANWPATPVPVLAWGNGTCAQPEGYGALLRYIASHGFFVVAANCRQVGTGAQMRRGIDFAAAANTNSSSPYYGHLDMSKVGVMGHSQGSSGTAAAASDSRVKAVILFNGGTPPSKPFAIFTGDLDITATNPTALQSQVNGGSKAAFFYHYNPAGAPQFGIQGHLVLMLTPQRVTDQATSWWQAVLNDDPAAKAKFTGTSCAFCGKTGDYAFGQKGI